MSEKEQKKSFFARLGERLASIDDATVAAEASETNEAVSTPSEQTKKVGLFGKAKNAVIAKRDQTVKSTANSLSKALKKEEKIRRRMAIVSTIYYLVSMIAYTVVTFANVFKTWEEAKNPWIVSILLALYVLSFFVITYFNIKMAKADPSSSTDKGKRSLQNYKSVSAIMKRVMSLFSLVLALFVALESWDGLLIYKIVSIAFIVFSLLKAVTGIVKQARAINKRLKTKKESKYGKVRGKLQDFADKNADEE